MATATGGIRRLLITMPPRHGKSELTSKYFPAWFLGRFPDNRIILTSYEADFASSWGRKSRDVLEANCEMFGVTVSPASSAANRWDIEGREGGMITAGVGGPITGRGGNLIIIDDPVKNAEQANSQVYREKTWEWYVSTVYTRLEPNGSIILIQTRWNEDDLAGRILKDAAHDGEQWTVLDLPALARANDPLGRQEGQALWPERYDENALKEIRRTIREYWFSALYQQSPIPEEGSIFKHKWFSYYQRVGDYYDMHRKDKSHFSAMARECRCFLTVDLAVSQKTSADYTVIAVWLDDKKGNLILADIIRDRLEGPDIVPLVRKTMTKWNALYAGIESSGFQLSIIQTARRNGLSVRELNPGKDKKEERAYSATVRMEGETVWFPTQAIWLSTFEDELLHFPNGPHDDQVDCLSYACQEMVKLYEIQKTSRPFIARPGPVASGGYS